MARPAPVAAGFASVMAATLVGMLWWDRPLDETRLPSPSATAPKVAEERSPATADTQSPQADADKAAARLADRLQESARAPAAAPAPAPAPAPRDATPAAAKTAQPRSLQARRR
jgi:hypothetical protein